MKFTDLFIRRPVLALVVNLIIIIAGLPPAYGLYAAMVPAIIAALYGSSHHLVSGPTTAASIVLFSALSALAEPGSADYVRLALTLSFMVGVIELTMGIARLGLLVNFISHAVVVGFTAGAAILIVLNQVIAENAVNARELLAKGIADTEGDVKAKMEAAAAAAEQAIASNKTQLDQLRDQLDNGVARAEQAFAVGRFHEVDQLGQEGVHGAQVGLAVLADQ